MAVVIMKIEQSLLNDHIVVLLI